MIVFLSAVLASSPYAYAELKIDLRPDKEAYALGEPVIAYVSIKNVGASASKVPENFEPDFMTVRYYVAYDGEEEKRFTPWAIFDSDTTLVSLDPGQLAFGTARIFFGADGWTFSKPGKYTLRAAYRSYTSPKFKIEVKKPTNKQEADAAKLLLDSKEAGYFLLFEGGDHLKEGIAKLNDLATKFPNSPLSAYANFALGANEVTEFADYSKNELRKANPAKAEMYFDRSKDQLVKSSVYYSTKATDALSEIKKQKGDLDGAKDIQRKFEKDINEKVSPMKGLTPNIVDAVRNLSKAKE